MNRQDRRKAERKINKDMDILRKMPEAEVKKVNDIIERTVKVRTDDALNAIDVSLSAILIDKGFKFKEILGLNDKLADYMNDDIEKNKNNMKERVDLMKLGADVREFLIKEIKGAREAGTKESSMKKEIIEKALFKFSNASKAKITTAYGMVIDELEIEDAAKYILEDNKKLKKIIKKEDKKAKAKEAKKVEKIVEEVAKDLQEKIEKEEKEILKNVKEEEKLSRFKINKQEVIKKVEFEGNNGTYQGQTGIGIALESNGVKLAFTNIESLDSFYEEFRQAFELI